jgi:uncharacterized protein YbjQ (UPF0145 family)
MSYRFAWATLVLTFAFVSAPLPLQASEESLAKDQAKYDAIRPADPNFLVTTTLGVEGSRIREYKGIVRGVTVRQPTIGQSLKASLKSHVGGRMSPFITMCETARQQAYDVMVERAKTLGANAIVGLRYDSSSFMNDNDVGTEVVCYGTAVVVEPLSHVVVEPKSFGSSNTAMPELRE